VVLTPVAGIAWIAIGYTVLVEERGLERAAARVR